MPFKKWTEEEHRASLLARFHQRVSKADPESCWEWQGTRISQRGRKTYGTINYGLRRVYAHRLAVELDGREADGKDVLHTCDNPPCCNPQHLVVGTNADNAADARTKGLRLTERCRRGHLRTAANTYIRTDSRGYVERHCRDCGKVRGNGSKPK